LHYSQIKE